MPLSLIWYLMYKSLILPYATTLLLSAIAAGFTLRVWVLQHDCGHGSLFSSRRVNDLAGSIFGVITMLPYHHWRHIHAIHHSHHGNLDRRGPGYLTTLTVTEYRALPQWRRVVYRLYRNPFMLLLPGALYYFLLQHRFAYDADKTWVRERRSVLWTNMGLLVLYGALAWLTSWQAVVMVHFPIVLIASSAGTWIFLNQHSFEDSYWARQAEWDYVRTALAGSSYYAMPRILQWFTASVGLHHVHHLNPRIPNYRLERCHRDIPELRNVKPLRCSESLATARLGLWDEKRSKMVPFGDTGHIAPARTVQKDV